MLVLYVIPWIEVMISSNGRCKHSGCPHVHSYHSHAIPGPSPCAGTLMAGLMLTMVPAEAAAVHGATSARQWPAAGASALRASFWDAGMDNEVLLVSRPEDVMYHQGMEGSRKLLQSCKPSCGLEISCYTLQ